MKKFFKWLVVTTIIITAVGSFFEYCVSRPCSDWITVPAAVALIGIVVVYLLYTIRLLIKFLRV